LDYKGIDVQFSIDAVPDFDGRPEIAWTVIDGYALAMKAFEFFEKNQHIITR